MPIKRRDIPGGLSPAAKAPFRAAHSHGLAETHVGKMVPE
jgi:hypothetical protein